MQEFEISIFCNWNRQYRCKLSSTLLVDVKLPLNVTVLVDFYECMFMSRGTGKPTKKSQRRPTNTFTFAQSDKFLLGGLWVANDPKFLHADSQDSDLDSVQK